MADASKTITIGLPLPKRSDYEFDVSQVTRECLNIMEETMQQMGYTIHEHCIRGVNVADHHNKLANDFMRGDWLLIVGSDHGFQPDALLKLLDAANKEPYPKIIAALMPYRSFPYHYVATKFAEHGRHPRPILPWRDFHPMEAVSEGIMEVDMVGSGFTLYHRSVFDTVPYPWFLYAPYNVSIPEIQKGLGEFKTDQSLMDYLEELSNGKKTVTNLEKKLLKQKAKDLRRILARAHEPTPYGPDYYMCRKAADYGIKSYVHFGCRVSHYDYVPVMHDNYLTAVDDIKVWWMEAMRAQAPTEQSIQKMRPLADMQTNMKNMSMENLQKHYDKHGNGKKDMKVEELGKVIEPEKKKELVNV